MGPQFKVSSDRQEKPGVKPWTPGLQGKQFNHYTTEALENGETSVQSIPANLKEILETCTFDSE